MSPQKTIRIEFDGGTPCNIPRLGFGLGYGSYQINDDPIVRIQFNSPMSCNQAEAETLAVALAKAREKYGSCRVQIGGDSQLVLKWVNRLRNQKKPLEQKNKNPWRPEFLASMRILHEAVKLHSYVSTQWRGRNKSVAIFGH